MLEIVETLVVTLRDDVARRQHITAHFHDAGLQRYGFWPAVAHTDPAVVQMYRSGRVVAFPPCFRCARELCTCANNVLIPQQVANWLSFLNLWRSLPDDADRYYLVCEDDVSFHANALDNLTDFMRDFRRAKPFVLIRLAHSGERPDAVLPRARPAVSNRVVMSNAAYILNGAMAAHLVRSFDAITTTSDEWLHRTAAQHSDVQALTLEPLLATDLSYNKDHARFVSRIHPKGIDEADVKRQAAHRKRANSVAEYRELLTQWGVGSDG